ncbi:NCS1 family nucleobase:cation symporter-1 [Acetobacter oeni]|uniref:Nitrate reductase n=1 Tax=Acetobacter oeni TaxID=304077 RepID=A0A511XPV5_9PROT|nr:NCS1 family nucleobase:cation symporter-1 [Acetobacter oeni]MBB3883725.1 NCS1 family nucleobase:cation symporter-1 [Acetobacter oeni]NHO19694.1 NCS1 family nucleobase:cation symporter-1 [Acetobacter oeni]GBR07416.1 APC transporter NCS1 [Acetobacter oeni LMG 21952]GEN64998.1 nitrate reductase [Acetobacter oeni]
MPETTGDHADSYLVNEDLAPVRTRNWGWVDYLSLWMSDVHSVAGYVTAGSLFTMGLPAGDVFVALILAILVVQLVCNFIAVPSFRSGAPFPVIARMSFGVHGAVVPAIVRGVIAVGWYGIQTWLASNAVIFLLLRFWPELTPWANVSAHGFLGLSLLGWGAFLFVWLLQTALFLRGMDAIRHFIDWAGPVIYVMMMALDVWLLWSAHWHLDFDVFHIAPASAGHRVGLVLNAVGLVIAFFSPIALNFGDFARYGRSMTDIRRGNFWGLPINFIGFSVLTLVTIALTQPVFGRLILDPVETVTKINHSLAVIIGVATFVVATIGINISANFVSAAFDFSNIAPARISWRKGGMIAAAGAIVVMPWNLYARPDLIHLTLDVLGTFIAPLTGILLADYYVVRKRQMVTDALYSTSPDGPYWYANGINPVAITALVLSVLCGLATVFVPLLAFLQNFSWFAGFFAGFILHTGLTRLASPESRQTRRAS